MTPFENHLKKTHPNLDIDKLLKLINDELDQVYPQPEVLPFKSDMLRAIIIGVIAEGQAQQFFK